MSDYELPIHYSAAPRAMSDFSEEKKGRRKMGRWRTAGVPYSAPPEGSAAGAKWCFCATLLVV